MTRIIRWILSCIARHKLDPWTLEETMRRELPPGTVKIKVIDFVREMHPFRWEDQGKKLTAHWLEETGDLVRSWDIVVIFEFDEAGHLLHYSQTETDFIDYDCRALMRK